MKDAKKAGMGAGVLLLLGLIAFGISKAFKPAGSIAEAAATDPGGTVPELTSDIIPSDELANVIPKYRTQAVLTMLEQDYLTDKALYEIHLRQAYGLAPDYDVLEGYYLEKTGGNLALAQAYAEYDVADYALYANTISTAEAVASPQGLQTVGTTINPTAIQVEAFATAQYWACEKIIQDPLAYKDPNIATYQQQWAEIAQNPEAYVGTPLTVALNPAEAIGYEKGAVTPAPTPSAVPVEEQVAVATQAVQAAEAGGATLTGVYQQAYSALTQMGVPSGQAATVASASYGASAAYAAQASGWAAWGAAVSK